MGSHEDITKIMKNQKNVLVPNLIYSKTVQSNKKRF
jgi:hypothetical protein